MKILVTGANGFVGTWLCKHLLENGDEVLELDPKADIREFNATVETIKTLQPEAIIHLAGFADVAASWKKPDEAFQVNAGGTLSVLQGALAAGSSKVLLISSAEVYGDTKPENLPIKEDQQVQPVSPYAVSKAAAELLGRQHYLANSLPTVVARPFNHIGPGQSPAFAVSAFASRIVSAITDGKSEIAVGDLSARRDFTDVRDVVRAYRLLLDSGAPGETYNVCSGQDIAMQDVVEQLIHIADASLQLHVDESLLRPATIPVMRGDNSRLVAATNWEREVSLEQSLTDVLRDWQSRT